MAIRGVNLLERKIESTVLRNGVEVFLIPAPKFKTVTVSLFLHQALSRKTATETALIPSILERGSELYPTTLALRRKLEDLYGAELNNDIFKKGERQVAAFSLDLLHDSFVNNSSDLLRQGLMLLKSIAADPLLEYGGFKHSYVEQEKEQLAKEIRGLINDKVSYSVERCVQEMCAEESFGTYKYGCLKDLEHITSEGSYAYYRDLLRSNPLQLFSVGDLTPDQIFPLVEEIFTIEREPKVRELPPVDVYHDIEEPKYIEERMTVNQGKLVLGYRTYTRYGDDDFFALLFYNGILGGFPHSKLFQNVREKASLAYYSFSRLEKHKGILMISSGIEIENYERALSIIKDQVAHMAVGNISEEEMEKTRRALTNQLRIQDDSPYQLVNFCLDGYIGGRDEKLTDFLLKVEEVSLEDVVSVAQKVKLDTVYFLRDAEGGKARV